MADLHSSWPVEIETLSPLHVGNGTELMMDYDLVAHQGCTYRVNEDVFLEMVLGRARGGEAREMERILMSRPAAELLTPADFGNAALFRYALAGEPRKREGGIPEQIKDAYDRPYLPGSSLKGALRTLLAWGHYAHGGGKPDLSLLGQSSRFAARPLEQGIFGPDPNHDFLRALHVCDSDPATESDALRLERVQVYPGGPPLELEAVRAGVVFNTTVTIEEYGFQEEIVHQLGWEGHRSQFGQLVPLGKEHARKRLEREAKFFGLPELVAVSGFYDRLAKKLEPGGLAEDEFLLQLGWGTGWEAKTLGSELLNQNDDTFERLLWRYRMTKERDRRPGEPFPKSRTLALRGGQPAMPLGWVRVKLVGFPLGEGAKAAPVTEKPAEPAPPPPVAPPRRPEDLHAGMVLEGTVRNITPQGAWVDLGVGHDGLLHSPGAIREGQRLRVVVILVGPREVGWSIWLRKAGKQ